MKMRNAILIMVFLLCQIGYLWAQNGYDFFEIKSEYEPLVSGDTLTQAGWNNDSFRLDLPFRIQLFGLSQPKAVLDGGVIFLEDDMSGGDTLSAISAFESEFISHQLSANSTNSPIILDIVGNPGARMMTLEYRNVYFQVLDGFFDFVNFQIKYYEVDGMIEFHYGESMTGLAQVAYSENGLDFGSQIGFGVGTEGELMQGLFLEGQTNNFSVLNDQLGFLSGFPSSGTVYQFRPKTSSTDEPQHENCLSHTYDLTTSNIYFDQNQSYYLTHYSGMIVDRGSSDQINLENFPKGLYLLNVTGCQETVKILRQ